MAFEGAGRDLADNLPSRLFKDFPHRLPAASLQAVSPTRSLFRMENEYPRQSDRKRIRMCDLAKKPEFFLGLEKPLLFFQARPAQSTLRATKKSAKSPEMLMGKGTNGERIVFSRP